MKRNIKLLAGCGLLIIVGVSCGSPNTPVPSVTPEISSTWWTSWLTQPVCQPPCWQNITPGITTNDEAISILESTPDITITYNGQYGLSWHFKAKTEGGDMRISKDGIVSSISLASVTDKKMLFKTIVGTYSEPEYVKPYDCNVEITMCYVALIYPDLGMFLEIYTENKGVDAESAKFEISPADEISRVYFFESGIENFPNLYNVQESEVPIPWKGFGEYP